MRTKFLLGLPFVETTIQGRPIEAMIDTGFNGGLLLPDAFLDGLKLPSVGVAEYIMADGTVMGVKVYVGIIDWLGKPKKVNIVSGGSDMVLIGMELLYDVETVLRPSKGFLSVK